MDKKPAWAPTDLTCNGICSRCGGCCSSLLPVTKQELNEMKKAADAIGYQPFLPEGENVIYLHCPFMNTESDGKKTCVVYGKRPLVCRHFLCNKTSSDMTDNYLEALGQQLPPEPVNVWSVYNQTGLRSEGKDISYDKAPSALLTCENGTRFKIHAGRPIQILLENGRKIPASLVLNVYEDAVQIFDAEKQTISIIRYDNIASILTESAILRQTRPTQNRAQRRKQKRKEKQYGSNGNKS